MTSAITVSSASFHHILREKILLAFLDLVPVEEIDNLIKSEVDSFFKTEALLTVTQTKIEVDNPAYKPDAAYSYGSLGRTLTKECLTFGSKMTPFRQMVWSELHQHIQPKVKAMLDDEKNKMTADLDAWLTETIKPDLQATNKQLFSHIATSMSSIMLKQVQQGAINSAHASLSSAMMAVGVNTGNIPMFPVVE